ncbi:MAG: hypothetical protein OES10_15500 [Gammaproteobacteria bacterium]|nr:hypothetical protein [Gammaproteobacteria bacterium]MDH3751778.1 hypothetical protein [Gammaproteobacteria bacterium]
MPQNRRSVNKLAHLHKLLCFERAFPASLAEQRKARAQLLGFEDRVMALPRTDRSKLWDSGIAGTPVHYRFSFEVARWLARRAPGEVSIDWAEIRDTTRLDELLTHLLQASEDEHFDGGYVSSRQWIETAARGRSGTDFDWLLAQLQDKRLQPFWSQLYDAADLPLVWNLQSSKFSKSKNVFAVDAIRTREHGMRKRVRNVKKEIQRPFDFVARLSARDGARLVDVAMASLAARHRETYHFNYANAKEVYLADVGEGVAIAVFGLLPKYRFPLECTMGYLILANGVPIGYGGSSIVFRQINTGINIFDEYRGSEASYLWVQVMRVYHALVGCTRFIANPYQFGADNTEGLKSGAFWFYYRLGYRPVLASVRKLAGREAARMRRNNTYRSDIKTLRELASCDMHLTLPGARAGDLFDERWLETSSMLANEVLGAAGGGTRDAAARNVANGVARDLGLRSLHRWSASERRAFTNIAPLVAAASPHGWSTEAKRSMRTLLRTKGGEREARYAQLLCKHDKFLNSLRKACRRADAE